MNRFLSAMALGLALSGGSAYAQAARAMPSPVEVEEAVSQHRLVDGMTLREANRAMPVRPKMVRAAGAIVGALWKLPKPSDVSDPSDSVRSYTVWSASVDGDGLLYAVSRKDVTEQTTHR